MGRIIMIEAEITNEIICQLERDYQVLDLDINNDKNLFICRENKNDGQRRILKFSKFLSVLCLGNKMIFCGDRRIIDWCREQYYDYPVQWFSNFDNLKYLNDKLNQYKYKINPYSHCYYIPSCLCNLGEIKYETKVLNSEQISSLTEKDVFKNSLFHNVFREEQMGMASYDNGKIIALIVATKKGNKIWEIAVDTRMEYRNRGIIGELIRRMTNYLLEKGQIPIYGTSESNINSQRAIMKANYKPMWYELYTQRMTMTIDK